MAESARTYLFASGGTGGHLFPGIAVAERLVECRPASRVLFVGSDRPVEREIMARTSFEHRILPALSLADARRHPLRFSIGARAAYLAAARLNAECRPLAVIGCGGFASAAPVLAARRQGVPFLLLEQNVIPGRATRWLSRLGGTVCLTYAESARLLPKAACAVVTGNPVRPDIAQLAEERLHGGPSRAAPPTLLVFGGSQGSQRINDLMLAVVREHRAVLDGWRIVHQTGAADEERVRAAYSSQKVAATVSAFFTDPAALYRQAAVAVSRAGGTTLSELACAGVPAVLLPYPHAVDDHQWHNAEVFRKAGAAVVFRDEPKTQTPVSRFADALSQLLRDADLRTRMSAAMSALARPDAADEVVKLLLSEISEPRASATGRRRSRR